MGIGFNGGELFAFALGARLSNHIQHVAHEMKFTVEELCLA